MKKTIILKEKYINIVYLQEYTVISPYPEPRWAGPTPAYGLFARHVDGLRLRNVKFELMRPDERPDIILEDVINEDLER